MTNRILDKRQVRELTSFSDATIYRLEKVGKFPKRRSLSAKRIGWLSSEIEEFIKSKANNCEYVAAAK